MEQFRARWLHSGDWELLTLVPLLLTHFVSVIPYKVFWQFIPLSLAYCGNRSSLVKQKWKWKLTWRNPYFNREAIWEQNNIPSSSNVQDKVRTRCLLVWLRFKFKSYNLSPPKKAKRKTSNSILGNFRFLIEYLKL